MFTFQVGASNTVTGEAVSSKDLQLKLKGFNTGSQCSVLHVSSNREIYYGSVGKVIELIGIDIECGMGVHVEPDGMEICII